MFGFDFAADKPTINLQASTIECPANREGPSVSIASFFSSSALPNSTVYGPMKEVLSEENPPKHRGITLKEKGLDGTLYLSNFRI